MSHSSHLPLQPDERISRAQCERQSIFDDDMLSFGCRCVQMPNERLNSLFTSNYSKDAKTVSLFQTEHEISLLNANASTFNSEIDQLSMERTGMPQSKSTLHTGNFTEYQVEPETPVYKALKITEVARGFIRRQQQQQMRGTL